VLPLKGGKSLISVQRPIQFRWMCLEHYVSRRGYGPVLTLVTFPVTTRSWGLSAIVRNPPNTLVKNFVREFVFSVMKRTVLITTRKEHHRERIVKKHRMISYEMFQ